MRSWSRVLIAAFVVVAGVVACSTDDPSGGDEQLGIDDGASAGIAKSVKVDGSVTQTLTLDTHASLTVPKGAVDREITIGIERPSDDKALELVKSLKSVKSVASAPYVLTPHGTKFNSTVTLALPVSKHTDRKLVVGWLEDEDDRDWKVLADAKVEDGIVKVDLKHFSVVALLDAEEAGLSANVPVDEIDAGTGADASATQDASVSSGADAGTSAPDTGSIDRPTDPDPQVADASRASTDAALIIPTDPDASYAADAGSFEDSYVPAADAAIDDDAYVPPDEDAQVAPDAASGSDEAGVEDDAGLGPDTGAADASVSFDAFT